MLLAYIRKLCVIKSPTIHQAKTEPKGEETIQSQSWRAQHPHFSSQLSIGTEDGEQRGHGQHSKPSCLASSLPWRKNVEGPVLQSARDVLQVKQTIC